MFDFSANDVIVFAASVVGLFAVVVLVRVGVNVAGDLLKLFWNMFRQH